MSELATSAEGAPEAGEKGEKKQADLLSIARDRFKEASDAWEHNHTAALEDIKFRSGDQWPDAVKKARGTKPCLVVDKLNQYLRQVVNDGRQNRPSVKVRPVDEHGDEEASEAFQGIIRDIWNKSNADEAVDTALDHAAGHGFGYMRVITDYCHRKTFNQELRVRRVRNSLAVVLGQHYLADGSDAEFGFFVDDVAKDRFTRQWPKAKAVNFDSDGFKEGWSTAKTVRVLEYFYRVETTETFHLVATGEMVSDAEYQRAVHEGANPPPIMLSREIPSHKVKWCRMTGAEVLEENDWLGKYIPIVPVYGNELDIEGKVHYSGLIRAAKDPQMLYNFARSLFAERVAMTPRSPWIAAEEQLEGKEDEWKKANSGEIAVLTYKAITIDGKALPPPQRVAPSDVPAGFAEDMKLSEHDIQGAVGMYNSSLGERSNEKSGKAIMARQREGDTSTFHYQDNLNRAIRYLGRILVDLIPKVYDSKRVVRILGEDGKPGSIQLDPQQKVASRKIGSTVIYNLGVGEYDVTVEAGPSYTTRRVEAADAMVEMTRNDPSLWRTHGDLIATMMDWPGAEEFAKRSRLVMPPELQQAIDGEGDDSEDPKVRALRAQVQQIIGQAKEREAQASQLIQDLQAENGALKQQNASKRADSIAKLSDSGTKAYEAETERMQVVAPAIDPAMVQMIVQQTVAAIMAQPVPGVPPPAAAPMQDQLSL